MSSFPHPRMEQPLGSQVGAASSPENHPPRWSAQLFLWLSFCTWDFSIIILVVATQMSIFFMFHPENWGRFSPNLTCAYFSSGLGKNHHEQSLNGTHFWGNQTDQTPQTILRTQKHLRVIQVQSPFHWRVVRDSKGGMVVLRDFALQKSAWSLGCVFLNHDHFLLVALLDETRFEGFGATKKGGMGCTGANKFGLLDEWVEPKLTASSESLLPKAPAQILKALNEALDLIKFHRDLTNRLGPPISVSFRKGNPPSKISGESRWWNIIQFGEALGDPSIFSRKSWAFHSIFWSVRSFWSPCGGLLTGCIHLRKICRPLYMNSKDPLWWEYVR